MYLNSSDKIERFINMSFFLFEVETNMLEYVYITISQNGRSYSVRHRRTSQEFLKDMELMDAAGYKLFRTFSVPPALVDPVCNVCCEFRDGNLSLENLEKRVQVMIDSCKK